MQRRHPRGLGAVGVTGWGSAPRQPLASDTEDEEPPRCPSAGDTASPRVVPESDPEESDVSPNVRVLRKRLPPPSAVGCAQLDVGGPKKRRLEPKTPPNPGVEPRNPSVSSEEVVGTDVEGWRGSDPTLGIESDTDDEEQPKSAVSHPNRHQSALEGNVDPNGAQRTPNPGVGSTGNGLCVLTVDSDTDEEAELLPPIRQPEIQQTAPNVPQTVGVGVQNPQFGGPRGPNEGFQVVAVGSGTDGEVESSGLGVGSPQGGQWGLLVDSDTDVEESRAHPDVERPQKLQLNPNVPTVGMETPTPPPGGPQEGREVLTADSDTDLEDHGADPDGLCSTTHRATQNAPNPPGIEADGPQKGRRAPEVGSDPDVGGTPSGEPDPDVGGPKSGRQLPLVDSDTDVEEDGACPGIPIGTPKPLVGSAVVMETPNPDPKGAQSGCQSLEVDSDTDVEEEELNPDVPHLKNPKTPQSAPQNPAVVMETPNPHLKGSQSGGQNLEVGSDTDVEGEDVNPDVPDLKNPKRPQITPKDLAVVVGTPNSDLRGSQVGGRSVEVDSDTDVEELNADVPHPENRRAPQSALKDPAVVMETPNPDRKGAQSGCQSLEVDSDTDVEAEELNPDVPHLKNPKTPQNAPQDPAVVMETPNPHLKGSQVGDRSAEVDSDTDVEGEELNPDVPDLKNPKRPQITPPDPAVVMETPNPHLKGSQRGGQNLEMDSDTDVEGEDVNPDVPDLKSPKRPQNTPKDPAVVMETPNSDLKGSQVGGQSAEADSDTDVEAEELNPDVPHLKNPKTPQSAPKDPAVVMETPNPDLKGSQVGDRSVEVDSDTDVEGEDINPDVPDPKDPKRPQITPQDPAVVVETPNPDVVGLNGDSDTDEDLSGVGAPQTPKATRGVTGSGAVGASAPDVTPDVAVTAPIPAVPPPMSLWGDSDTDGEEEVAPTPHIRRFRSRIRLRNPNVGSTAMGGGADVGQTDPKCGKLTPKRQSSPPEQRGDGGVGGTAPKRHNSAPDTDAESPKPNDGTQRRSGETLRMGGDTAAAPAPKSPDSAPNLGRPNGGTDVTESDTEAEGDSDLFLAPTQSFLPPTQSFLPPPTQDPTPAWDPEEPTQCFYHPEEEEGKEEEPPQSRVATRVAAVTPAQEDSGTIRAPSEAVAEGPRRSQRQARSRGGGASREGGGAKAAGGGATADPPPLRRSPRLLARSSPAEPKRGRGQDEPRPPPAPRPRRGGHAPSQKKAQEEEPTDITRAQLRPRGSSASSSPKVLFTGVVASPGMEAALGALGGSMAASVFDCTHLVTDRVRRTIKFLCAVARGIAIVTPTWLHESSRSGRILPPGPFLVRDSQQEQHFGFSLSQALSRARRRPLLQGYEIHVTPSVRPEPEHMRDIITCSGGTFLPTMPCTYGPRRLVISCPEDSGRWGPALGAQLPLLSAELLLTGLLRQQLQLQPFLLTPPGPPQDPPVSPRRLRDRAQRDPPGTRRRGRLGVK
ncbi:mediator of DNA damage checkpoint protein 1-like [Gallus gallus]|uniref:mediator of DNA damage checkpoint protein 1-like n=1 Tax=Gallus gallus TaxID=9031 RepID=UPI001AE8E981|nr:mediator of DNA damage checkpoint protein 1-like [Gallus gallus]